LVTHYPETPIVGLILDLGGGTFDVAVVKCGAGVVEITAVDGDKQLGGRDFDEIVRGMLNDAIDGLTSIDNEVGPLRIEPLDPLLERTKLDLNSGHDVTVLLGERETWEGEVVACTTTLKYDEFVRRCRPLVSRIEAAIARVRERAPFPDDPWDEDARQIVMFAGQGTRLNVVRAAIEKLFPGVEIFDRLQENAVATGLAQQPGVLHGVRKDILLVDVYHRRLGFFRSGTRNVYESAERPEGRAVGHLIGPSSKETEFFSIFSEHITIPTRRSVYITFVDGADSITLIERDVADDGAEDLAVIRVKDPSSAEWWEVEFDFDANTSIAIGVVPLISDPRTGR
jgi:molecular chaperone DnaK